MIVKDNTRQGIESKLSTMGDYVRIDFLSRCLKNNLDFDTRKFVLTTISRLYEQRNMFNDAARALRNSAEINPTFQGKIND